MEPDQILKDIYYNAKIAGSFGGVETLFQSAKSKIPGLTRNAVAAFLSKEDTYTLHKPYRKIFQRNKIIVSGVDKQWQVDLADMVDIGKDNDGYRYLLTCIDCFSKYAWVTPVKTKGASDMEIAFITLFSEAAPRKPERIQSDKGLEFLNSKVKNLLKSKNIILFQTESDFKAAMVERFNRTLKTKIWKYVTANNTHRYLEVLPDLVKSYNLSIHRSIGMRPIEVKRKHEEKIFQRLYSSHFASSIPLKRPHHIDEQVRISKTKRVFDKGYLPNWTEEYFQIKEPIPKHHNVYKLEDFEGEELKGSFYPLRFKRLSRLVRD